MRAFVTIQSPEGGRIQESERHGGGDGPSPLVVSWLRYVSSGVGTTRGRLVPTAPCLLIPQWRGLAVQGSDSASSIPDLRMSCPRKPQSLPCGDGPSPPRTARICSHSEIGGGGTRSAFGCVSLRADKSSLLRYRALLQGQSSAALTSPDLTGLPSM